ncbi:uncharacterized protein LOC108213268 [Daucus carota subsp. sativus]|nr:PREDICTED: uncharacterized protein LOC108213268 [Daucus carota subsp. sativus]
MSWADLPVDILFIIFGFVHNRKNFNMIDLYQCLAVCHSWRSVAKQIWRNHILPTTPWLVSTIDASTKINLKTDLYNFYKHPPSLDINKSDASFSFTLDLFHLRTFASCDGWLLLGNYDNLPFLYNPITLVLLQLPVLPQIHMLYHMKFVSSGASPTDHECMICLKFSNKRGHWGGYDDYNNYLAFCRPASSTSWVILHEKSEDYTFSGGKFYTISNSGELFLYNSEILNGNTSVGIGHPWKEIKIAGPVFNGNLLLGFNDRCFFYLLESKHKVLLMVMRLVEDNKVSRSFRIFKLNSSDNNYDIRRSNYYPYYWKEISNLPEKESIILLWNEGMSISVDDHNGYKSNCIYFYDEDGVGQLTTYGIYEVGTRKIKSKSANHYSGDAGCYNFHLFTPSKISNF